MPPRKIDLRRRSELSELMDEPCSRNELHGCLKDIARLNRWFLAYRPVLQWLDSLKLAQMQPLIHILDVGCGFGDGLRRIEAWASARKIPLRLTGLDLNPLWWKSPRKPLRHQAASKGSVPMLSCLKRAIQFTSLSVRNSHIISATLKLRSSSTGWRTTRSLDGLSMTFPAMLFHTVCCDCLRR
jgi:hypothetical protein